jgi:dihydroorotase
LVIAAKEEGLPITCEVSAHHLLLTEDDARNLPTGIGYMKPPLSTRRNVHFLRDNNWAIDALASDHAPHTNDEKGNFTHENGPYGATGIETTLPILFTEASKPNSWITPEKVIDMCSKRPREIFGLAENPDTVTEIIVNGDKYVIKGSELETKAKNTPFEGYVATARVSDMYLEGHKILEKGEIIGLPRGRVLRQWPA